MQINLFKSDNKCQCFKDCLIILVFSWADQSWLNIRLLSSLISRTSVGNTVMFQKPELLSHLMTVSLLSWRKYWGSTATCRPAWVSRQPRTSRANYVCRDPWCREEKLNRWQHQASPEKLFFPSSLRHCSKYPAPREPTCAQSRNTSCPSRSTLIKPPTSATIVLPAGYTVEPVAVPLCLGPKGSCWAGRHQRLLEKSVPSKYLVWPLMIYLVKICSLDISASWGSDVRFVDLQAASSCWWLQELWRGPCCELQPSSSLPLRLISSFQQAFDYQEKSALVYEASVVGIWTQPHNRWRLVPAVTG